MADKTIERVLSENRDTIMALPGVVGIAIGKYRNQPCIRVLVSKKNRKLLGQIPDTLDKYQVVVQETGEFLALDS